MNALKLGGAFKFLFRFSLAYIPGMLHLEMLTILKFLLKNQCYFKKQIAEAKTKHIFLNSARSFVNNCSNFQAIMYTMSFNKVTIMKIFELNC